MSNNKYFTCSLFRALVVAGWFHGVLGIMMKSRAVLPCPTWSMSHFFVHGVSTGYTTQLLLNGHFRYQINYGSVPAPVFR